MKLLHPYFSVQTNHTIAISSGSTGKHFAQIKNGAPFDLFFAADISRPALLEDDGYGLKGSRFTYAVGRLVLWSATLADVNSEILNSDGYRWLALANPRHAPYGLAAKQTLQNLNLWSGIAPKLLRAENVNQAFQFVATNNAKLGFASQAQVRYLEQAGLFKGSYWLVPKDLHSPIEQQAILLKDSAAAREFMAFMKSDEAQKIIRDHGYDTL